MAEIVSFSEWVQKRRNQLRWSWTGLARQVGCLPIMIQKIERDGAVPPYHIISLTPSQLHI